MSVPTASTDLCEIWSKAFKILEPSFPHLEDREIGLHSTKSCGTSAYSGKHTYSRTPKQTRVQWEWPGAWKSEGTRNPPRGAQLQGWILKTHISVFNLGCTLHSAREFLKSWTPSQTQSLGILRGQAGGGGRALKFKDCWLLRWG